MLHFHNVQKIKRLKLITENNDICYDNLQEYLTITRQLYDNFMPNSLKVNEEEFQKFLKSIEVNLTIFR